MCVTCTVAADVCNTPVCALASQHAHHSMASQFQRQPEQAQRIGGGDRGGALRRLAPCRRHQVQHVRQQRGLIALRSCLAGAADGARGEVGAVCFDQQTVICRAQKGGREGRARCDAQQAECCRGGKRVRLRGEGRGHSRAGDCRAGRAPPPPPARPRLYTWDQRQQRRQHGAASLLAVVAHPAGDADVQPQGEQGLQLAPPACAALRGAGRLIKQAPSCLLGLRRGLGQG